MNHFQFKIGSALVEKVHEMDLKELTLTQLLPSLDPKVVNRNPSWFDEKTYQPKTEKITLSLHSWLVRHDGRIILIDTGAGNGKIRPTLKVLDHLHDPFLNRLAKLGVKPEDVNFIILTHIHADHVGWNTSWDGEKWVPTFPNATVICSDREWRYSAALAAVDERALNAIQVEAGVGQPVRLPTTGVFDDSMLPLEKSGQIRRVTTDGSEILPGFRYISTPGHSIDHASISFVSDGEEAIFGGDILHSPLELYRPEVVSMFCEFPEAARKSRKVLVRRVAGSNALYFSSHFPESSFGNITASEEAFRWKFVEGDA